MAESGVSDAGLKTTVLPQTSAGAIFHDGIAIGKFQGVMTEQTPIGWRTDIANLSRSSEGTVWPYSRRPSPAMKYVMSIASWTSPRVSSSTLPISRVMSRANCSLRSAMICAARSRISARRGAGTWRHGRAGAVRGSERVARVFGRRLLENADQIVLVGGIAVLELAPGTGGHPLSVDEVVPGPDGQGNDARAYACTE